MLYQKEIMKKESKERALQAEGRKRKRAPKARINMKW